MKITNGFFFIKIKRMEANSKWNGSVWSNWSMFRFVSNLLWNRIYFVRMCTLFSRINQTTLDFAFANEYWKQLLNHFSFNIQFVFRHFLVNSRYKYCACIDANVRLFYYRSLWKYANVYLYISYEFAFF